MKICFEHLTNDLNFWLIKHNHHLLPQKIVFDVIKKETSVIHYKIPKKINTKQ